LPLFWLLREKRERVGTAATASSLLRLLLKHHDVPRPAYRDVHPGPEMHACLLRNAASAACIEVYGVQVPSVGLQGLPKRLAAWHTLPLGVPWHGAALYARQLHSTHSKAQHSTAQHSAAQRSAAQHSKVQQSKAKCSTPQRCKAQHTTAKQSAAQHNLADQHADMHLGLLTSGPTPMQPAAHRPHGTARPHLRQQACIGCNDAAQAGPCQRALQRRYYCQSAKKFQLRVNGVKCTKHANSKRPTRILLLSTEQIWLAEQARRCLSGMMACVRRCSPTHLPGIWSKAPARMSIDSADMRHLNAPPSHSPPTC
jgi:hypothetical protein